MNVILTGSTDGVVRMWSLDYVQVSEPTHFFYMFAASIDYLSSYLIYAIFLRSLKTNPLPAKK